MGGRNDSGKSNNFIMQGTLLAAASILCRVIGLLYRLPVTNIIGDQGNDYYSAAYEVYNVILLISSYSLPLAVSKVVSARIALGEYRNAWQVYKAATVMALVVGVACSAVTFFGAGFFTGTLLSTPESELCLKVLAIAVFVMAVMGVLRGFFQGLGTMMPTAVSQIIEQIVNAAVSIAAASALFKYGTSLDAAAGITDGNSGAIYGAAGSTLGTSLGAAAGLLFLIIVMLVYNRVLQRRIRRDHVSRGMGNAEILKVLALTIMPVILSTAVYNISGIVDQGVFKYLMLNVQGAEKETVEIYWGIYVGKYKLLTNVPIAVASALSASTIPALTRARMEGNWNEMRRKAGGAVKMVMFVCIPSAFGLAALGEPILDLLGWNSNAVAPMLFYIGSAAVVFYGLSTLTNGILQGIDKMKIPVRNAVISLCAHLVLLVILVRMGLHIYGVVISYMFFALLMCVLNALAIRKHLGYRQEVKKTFVIPAVSSAVMAAAAWGLHRLLSMVLGNAVSTVAAIAAAVVIYIILMLIFKGITEEDIYGFPMGGKIVGILGKTGLLR